jgi:hypothetical protein
MVVYKIRRKTDGLFSKGGSTPSFNKDGKVWKQRGHLTNHLNQIHNRSVYGDCEIIVYKLEEVQQGDGISIDGYLDEREQKKRDEENERNLRYEAMRKEQRRKEYEALKAEFEDNP